jgi:hypothetical protein
MCEVVNTHKASKWVSQFLRRGIIALAKNGDVQFGKRNFMQ